MTPRYNLGSADELFRKANLNERFQDFAWGILLLVLGTLWLLPANSLPPGSWLIATGLVMLALNVIRYIYEIKMNGFSLFVGVLAMLAGLGEFFFLDVPVLAIAMLLLGFWMLLKPLLEKNAISLAWRDLCCCGPGNLKSNPSPTRGQPCEHRSAPR